MKDIKTKTKIIIKSILSKIAGIVSVVSMLLLFPWFVVLLLSPSFGIAGTVIGMKTRKESTSKSEWVFTTVGIVCSIAGLLCSAVFWIMLLLILSDFLPFLELFPYEDGHFIIWGIAW